MTQAENNADVEKVIDYLRGCSRAGGRVSNPLVELRKARALQIDESGRPKPGYLVSRMSADEIKRENKDAERIAEFWHEREELEAERVLQALLEHDSPINGTRPVSFCKSTHWEAFAMFARHIRHVSSYETDALGHEKEGFVGQAKKVSVEFDNMTRGLDLLRNPLVALRELEDRGEDVRYDKGQLIELEGLSRRLWHMTTVCGVNILRSRLLLEPDCGEADLALAASYHDLLGLVTTDGGENGHVANKEGSSGLGWPDENRRPPF